MTYVEFLQVTDVEIRCSVLCKNQIHYGNSGFDCSYESEREGEVMKSYLEAFILSSNI